MLNRVILVGRLVADPEVATTPSGISRVRFRMAVDRNYKNKQGERDTDFISIVAWRRLAEIVGQYAKKGRLILVEGRLEVRDYQTPEGENRRIYEVVADNVQFLEWGERSPKGASAPESEGPDSDPPPADDDNLPF